jgi:hypothetical protein
MAFKFKYMYLQIQIQKDKGSLVFSIAFTKGRSAIFNAAKKKIV